MDIDKIQSALEILARYGFEAVLAGVVVFLLIKYFLPGYLSQKGKNIALQEDIEKLTTQVEQIRSHYQSLLEIEKAKHQLRMAAIDKRLEAHQEAYALWREINSNLSKPELRDTVIKCDQWWSKNSLYLEPEPREAFLNAWVSAKDLEWYKENNEGKLVSECYKAINAAGEAITNAVELPALNEIVKDEKRA